MPEPTAAEVVSNISDQSALTPANFTTLAHFSVSSARSLPKSAGEPGSTRPAGQFKVRLDLRIDESGVDLFVEPIDNLGGRVLGGAEAIEHSLKARDEFAHGRDVRKCGGSDLGIFDRHHDAAGAVIVNYRTYG